MEVLVVAVKRDIINSYTDAIRAAGLDPVVVDVDYFALENMFELNYDAAEGSSVALVNIGARYSSINILKDGRSTFTGDVPVGGAEFTDALVRQLGVSPADADALKRGRGAANIDAGRRGAGPRLGHRVHRRGDPARAQLLLDGGHRRAARRRCCSPAARRACRASSAQLTERLDCDGRGRRSVPSHAPSTAASTGRSSRRAGRRWRSPSGSRPAVRGTNDPHQPPADRRGRARRRSAPADRDGRARGRRAPCSLLVVAHSVAGGPQSRGATAAASGARRARRPSQGPYAERARRSRRSSSELERSCASSRSSRRRRAGPVRILADLSERDAREALADRVRRGGRHAQAHRPRRRRADRSPTSCAGSARRRSSGASTWTRPAR